MNAPERILAWPHFGETSVTGQWSANQCHTENAVEYIRADAILSDPRVKALVEAVEHERNMACQDIDMQLRASEAVDAALAAIKEGK